MKTPTTHDHQESLGYCHTARWRWAARSASLLIAFLLLIPTLSRSSGYLADDWPLLDRLKSAETLREKLDLYALMPGESRERLAGKRGDSPWFAAPDFKLVFFRPLSSLLLVLDHAVAPGNARFAAAHSCIWYLVLILVVCELFFCVSSGLTALLATAVFAVFATNASPVVSVPSRNALVAVTFGLAALVAVIRDRSKLGVVLLSLGLLAGETSVCAVLLIGCYEAARGRGIVRTFQALLPMVCICLIYLLVLRWWDAGVQGSSAYIHPTSDPHRYLMALPERVGFLVAALLGLAPDSLWSASPLLRPAAARLGGVGFILMFLAVIFLARDRRPRPVWLFWASFLTLLPAAAGIPSGRSLLWPSIGCSLLVASLLTTLVARCCALEIGWVRSVAEGALAVVLVLCFLVRAPLSWQRHWNRTKVSGAVVSAVREMDRRADLAGKHVVIAANPDPLFASYLPCMRRQLGLPGTASFASLSFWPLSYRLVRRSERVLEVIFRGPPQCRSIYEEVLTNSESVPRTAYRPGFRIDALGPEGWRGGRLRLTLSDSIGRYLFLRWTRRILVPMEIPAVGQHRDIRWLGSFSIRPPFVERRTRKR